MTIYTIIAQPNPNIGKLPAAIAAKYPNDYLQLNEQAWLVATKSTINQLSEELGIANGTNGAAVITEVGGYFGRANPNIWNWIKTKWEITANA